MLFSSPSYYTTDETATAYAPFTGPAIDMSRVKSATLTTIMNRGGDGTRGAMLFNDQTWPDYWVRSSSAEIAANTTDVTSLLKTTGNTAMFRSQAKNNMDMEPYLAILKVEYRGETTLPVAAFTASNTTGTAPVVVKFTDASTGTPTSWSWDFGDGSTSTDQDPTHTYETAGNYTVTLTATNALGSNSITKTDYIAVTSGGSAGGDAPVASFNVVLQSGQMPHGIAPVTVSFTDASTGGVADTYLWEYRNYDDTTWTAFGSGAQNPTGIVFTEPGTYDVRLTVTNATYGSSTKTIAHAFTAGELHDYLTTVTSGTVSGDLYVNSQSPWPDTTATYSYTLPASGSSIAWARVYVDDYSGSGTNNFPLRITTELDPTGTGSWTTLGNETCDIQSETNGDSPDGQPYVYPVNDHVMKVYSDYEAWYDVTGLLTTTTPQIRVTSSDIGAPVGTDGGFDGRIKAVTLVIAYNDGSTNTVKYIVNHGNDWMTGSSSTAFDASSFASGWTSATLTEVGHSSTDASYTINSNSITKTALGTNSYWKYNSFDVTSALTPAATNTFGFTNNGASFKICLATLAAKYPASTTGPVAAFTGTPTSGTVPLEVTFTDASTGNVTGWSWDFGDNSTSTGQNPVHTYTANGTYTVNLTVTGTGGTDSEVKTDYITVGTAISGPVAAFSGTPTSGTAPLTVAFTDASTGNITGWSWAFGDGETSTVQSPSHTYSTPGTYSVSLAVTGPEGNNTATRTGYITVGTLSAPVAAFSSTPTSGTAPLSVQFTDASTGTVAEWAWDFDNDGTIDSVSQNPGYTYGTVGNYTVSLKVTNAAGSDTVTRANYISVTEKVYAPVADFSANTTSGAAPLTVQFTDASTNSPTSWTWDFGDNTTSTGQSPVHKYTTTGTYTVTLAAANSAGTNTYIRTGYITVTAAAIALPDQTNVPTDPDGDGLYEDLNGNSRKDYNDLQVYFSNMVWMATNEPVAFFDFNGNERIDYNDLQALFREFGGA